MSRLDDIRNKHSRNLQNGTSIPSGTEPGVGKVGSWRNRAKVQVTNVSDKFNEFLEESNNNEGNGNISTGYGTVNRNDVNRVSVNIQEPVSLRNNNNQPADKFAGLQEDPNINVRNHNNGVKRNYNETVNVPERGASLGKFEGLLENEPVNVNVGGVQRGSNIERRQDRYNNMTNNEIPQEKVVSVESRHYENRELPQKTVNNRNVGSSNENIHNEYSNTERNIRVEESSNNMPSIPKETHIITRESKDLTIGIAGAVAKTGRVNGGIGSDQMESELLSPMTVFEGVDRKDRIVNRTILRPDQEYTLAYVPTSVCAVIPEIVAVEGGTEFTIDGVTYVVSRKPETS